MESYKSSGILMSPTCKLSKDEHGLSVNQKLYRGMIICICTRFQAEPKESHLKSVKRIFKYLKATKNVKLWYFKQSTFELINYSDADYAGCKLDRKSISRSC